MKKRIWIGGAALLLGMVAVVVGFRFVSWREVSIRLSPDYNGFINAETRERRGHETLLPEYNTNVSIAYQNKDGSKTLYVFASPIRYQTRGGQLSLIDTRLANVRDEELRKQGYLYTIANSDIESFFPKSLSSDQGVLLRRGEETYTFGVWEEEASLGWYRKETNFLGEKTPMVVYKKAVGENSLCLCPSSLGVNSEIDFQKPPENGRVTMWMRIPDANIQVRKEPGGYLILFREIQDTEGNPSEEIVGVIQRPLLKDSTGRVTEEHELELLPRGDGLYELRLEFYEDAFKGRCRGYVSFEFRRDKQADNALYSNLPSLKNAYLRNVSVIGNSLDYGIGRLMIRFKVAKAFGLQSFQIIKTEYVTRSLGTERGTFELVSVLEDWCSLTGNWNNHYKTGPRTALLEQTESVLRFDITNEMIAWCDNRDGQMEHNGVQLRCTEEQEGVSYLLLSNDNALYPNRTEIQFE